MPRILPTPTPVSEPYWQGCRDGELRLQQCDDCECYQFYPRNICSHCGATSLTWRVASGRGRIASFTVVRRPVAEGYPADSVVLLVDLEEGPRMMSSLLETELDTETDSNLVGSPVQVEFSNWSDEVAMPVFRLVTEVSE